MSGDHRATLPTAVRLAEVRQAVLAWYEAQRRDLPWRGTRDPYEVLVSEVMLQQTQASRVAARFPRFLARFPTAVALARAPTAQVLAEWTGLGYNRRAIALQGAAATVSERGWPRHVAGLERLPGVGPYTARAVASLAFDMPVGVLDTNVRRWLLRRFDVPDRRRVLQELSDALAAPGCDGSAAPWTHASMEFGALVCRSAAPRCDGCPIRVGCPSRGRAARVPVPSQPPLHGSDRAYRGAVVRLLAAHPRRGLPEAHVRAAVGASLEDERWERVLAGLERDALAHRHRGALRLATATIDA